MRDDTTPTGFTGLDVEDDKVMNKINANITLMLGTS